MSVHELGDTLELLVNGGWPQQLRQPDPRFVVDYLEQIIHVDMSQPLDGVPTGETTACWSCHSARSAPDRPRIETARGLGVGGTQR